MTTNEEGELTTAADISNDGDFAAAFQAGIAQQAPPEEPAAEVTPDGEEDGQTEETTVPETLDLEEEDQENPASPFADVEALLEKGDTDAVKARLEQMKPGIERLRESHGTLTGFQKAFDDAAKGVPTAIEAVDTFLSQSGYDVKAAMIRMGVEPEELLAVKLGMTRDEVERVLYEDGVPPIKAGVKTDTAEDKRLAELQARLDRIEKGSADTQWASTQGVRISNWIEQATGHKYDPAVLSIVKDSLPTRGLTVQHVEDAIMKHDPAIYRAAVKAASEKAKTPAEALVSKGGKSSGGPAPSLLDDPSAFARYVGT